MAYDPRAGSSKEEIFLGTGPSPHKEGSDVQIPYIFI
jgi:hypothetical protein